MFEVKGKYSTAKIFTDNIEQTAVSQIIELCNQDFTIGSTIRIMPDAHAGAGCVIGFTADLGDKVVPNLVGVDIGCGMLTSVLKYKSIYFSILDDIIKNEIPAGREVHKFPVAEFDLTDLYCYPFLKSIPRLKGGIGSLGGGNHFIEVDVDEYGHYYLVIHSGSRNLGKQVAEHYQDLAVKSLSGANDKEEVKRQLIVSLKAQGKQKEIAKALQNFEKEYANKNPTYPKEFCYLEGTLREQYLHDMLYCQRYAHQNRVTMMKIILNKYEYGQTGYYEDKTLSIYNDTFTTMHNYIDPMDNIIRKGAVSAYEHERILIPINMRDGSLICIGKGNEDWNYSAPHGAGRIMSRSMAKKQITMQDYVSSMQSIFTSSVNLNTIDEAPQAYKPMEEIIENIKDTVKVMSIIKPVYNFKAGGD